MSTTTVDKLLLNSFVINLSSLSIYWVFSLTWPASMQIYWNKRKRLHKKRVQFPQDWFGTPTWPLFHCFGTRIWPPWRHVKTLYRQVTQDADDDDDYDRDSSLLPSLHCTAMLFRHWYCSIVQDLHVQLYLIINTNAKRTTHKGKGLYDMWPLCYQEIWL